MRGRYLLDREVGVVVGAQTYKEFDTKGGLVREAEMPMRFRLPGAQELEALAAEEGFVAQRWCGDYEGGPYEPEHSPFIISEMRRG